MFKLLGINDQQTEMLIAQSFDTEAAAEATARQMLNDCRTDPDLIQWSSIIMLRPVAEFQVVTSITMKEWKQMLKDQADG